MDRLSQSTEVITQKQRGEAGVVVVDGPELGNRLEVPDDREEPGADVA